MTVVRFQRVAGNTDLAVPAYATPGAAGLDLRAFLPDGPLVLELNRVHLVPTGFRVELPAGTEMQIRARSGLALKHGIILPNAPGTVDEDYRGEVMVGLMNLGQAPFAIAHGERIAQAVIADVRRVTIEEAATLSDTARGAGGFGSTGRE
ncbi:dUTP diphosphatase [Mesobacterium sp. TK19101]|uniref:Deoxyuridine 5'-triphosphate nucleotidohydrolase n=1 Tax=Mesobacterium hydrothermale TaxID=3111907 RepID=A0ABU6HE97_9RHOB|nr:dUTP diphosphatase [Mesobacterium sp. TK19101]MEC3860788.1 dUTP diphosphatase [Mesobacterium sp. TK19101]